MINQEDRPELEQSEIIEALPLACSDELAAVEFIEEQRWGKEPKASSLLCCASPGASTERQSAPSNNPDGTVTHVNSCESFFSLLKRGVMGAFHHVSPEHLHRYVNEFEFRWNHRKTTDGERMIAGLKKTEGAN